MSLLDIIKMAGAGAVESGSPVNVVPAVVTQTDPLEVNVDQRFSLPAEVLVVPEHLREYRITVGETEYVIRRPLETGDAVWLLRAQGGQRYLILDRTVSA